MSDASRSYRTVAGGFTARVEGVDPQTWSAATPCTDWTARELVAHVIRTHRSVMSRLDGVDASEVDVSGDLVAQWRVATAAVSDALADEARASTIIGGMFGEQPFSSVVANLVCADTLVHTWDLARATGQDERVDPDAVANALAFLTPMDEAIRRPGGFGPKIEPPAGADPQTVWLNFCGRAV